MKALYKRRFSFQDKLNVWLSNDFHGMRCFLCRRQWVAWCWMLTQRFGMHRWCLAGFQLWAYSLPTCQLGRLWEFAVAIFQKQEESVQGEIVSTFLTTRTSGRVLSDKQSGSRKRKGCTQRTNSILQEPLVQVMYLLGIHSKFRPKEIWITNFSLGAQHADLLDTTANGTSQVFLLDIQLCHGYLEVKQFSFGCQPIQDH